MVEAIAHKTGGGIDDHLKNQRAIVFVLSQGKPDPNGPNNPAKAFELVEGGIVRRDEQDFVDENWPRVESMCRNLAAAMRASLPEPERRAFAGFIPVAFHFRPTEMTAFHQYPVYRLRAHGSGPSYDQRTTEEERMLFNNVVRVCAGYMNQGLVPRASGGDYNRPLPDVGSYKRSKKTWVWVHWVHWQWDTFQAIGEGDAAPIFVAETLVRYHKLLAQRNFE